MKKTSRRCPACEQGVLVARPSQEPMPYRHAVAVMPATPVEVPTCTVCGEQFVDGATAKAWDAALEAGLTKTQQRLVVSAIERLGSVHTQREWEKRLGVSAGYLSRLRSGKEASVPLTTLLAILAESPAASWNRLERLWSAPALLAATAPTVRLVLSQTVETRTVGAELLAAPVRAATTVAVPPPAPGPAQDLEAA